MLIQPGSGFSPRRARAVQATAAHGSALVLVLLAVFAVAAALLASAFALDAGTLRSGQPAREPALLAAARARVLQWYAQHLGDLDGADPFALAPEQVLRAAAVDESPALRFAAGPLGPAPGAGGRGWRARPLALWLAASADDRTGFDDQGALQLDPAVRYSILFSSAPLQQAAYARSEETLRTLATMAELQFLARLRADPDHDLAHNWFRPANCDQVDDDFPCTTPGRPQPVDALMATARIFGAAFSRPSGTPPAQQRDGLAFNAWGGVNWFDNAVAAAPTASPATAATPGSGGQPPFSMRFFTLTPFGGRIEIVAVGPVE
jgi:hypothetical protein